MPFYQSSHFPFRIESHTVNVHCMSNAIQLPFCDAQRHLIVWLHNWISSICNNGKLQSDLRCLSVDACSLKWDSWSETLIYHPLSASSWKFSLHSCAGQCWQRISYQHNVCASIPHCMQHRGAVITNVIPIVIAINNWMTDWSNQAVHLIQRRWCLMGLLISCHSWPAMNLRVQVTPFPLSITQAPLSSPN